MKSAFSTAWKSSTQTRKQRKYRYNAPLHTQGQLMGSHLSKELRKKQGTRSIRIRKGDEVKVMVGNFKGKTGKVGIVDIKKQRVTIDGMQNKKKDGTKINAFFNASNLMIITLNIDDKMRFKRKNITQETKTKTEKAGIGTSDKSEVKDKEKKDAS